MQDKPQSKEAMERDPVCRPLVDPQDNPLISSYQGKSSIFVLRSARTSSIKGRIIMRKVDQKFCSTLAIGEGDELTFFPRMFYSEYRDVF